MKHLASHFPFPENKNVFPMTLIISGIHECLLRNSEYFKNYNPKGGGGEVSFK